MTKPLFIVGTDTEVGKTYLTQMFGLCLSDSGHQVGLCKPVASGCHVSDGTWICPDTEALHSVTHQKTAEITPWHFELPIGPWSASRSEDQSLSVSEILQHINQLQDRHDILLVEGIGGVSVPLNETELFVDLIKESGCGVFLVIGLKLGCINHTMLTMQVLESLNIPVLGVALNECHEGVSQEVKDSSFFEIQSRIPSLQFMPYAPSLPTAISTVKKILDGISWPETT